MKATTNNLNEQSKDKLIEKTLKTCGFLFPETIAEVQEYERLFGNTEFTLPLELQDPTYLFDDSICMCKVDLGDSSESNFAMAARDGLTVLPNDIQTKIISNIMEEELEKKDKI